MVYYKKQYAQSSIAIVIILASVAALAAAWFFQNILNMAPCGLCLLGRWPYRILMVMGIFLLITPSRLSSFILAIVMCILVASLGLSFVHIGVEQLWWRSPLPECYSVATNSKSITDLFMRMSDHPSRPCDLPTYFFDWLPVSLTMFNAIYSFILFSFVAISIYPRKSSRRFFY